ncbi:MAG: 2-amino-4-hydroxy-6-hydroxymethyldihydropteridine diphosphokinase [Candidatus Fimenecus sp.]
MNKAYLGIGTNIGDRMENLQKSIDSLNLLPLTKVSAISNIYETAPVGYDGQDDFLNIAVEVETDLPAESLLGAALGIEAGIGRVRTVKNGPRVIDIDLLLYENEEFNTPTLTLPHPRMFERGFVLIPLLDIDFNNSLFDREKIKNSVKSHGVRLFADKSALKIQNKR